VSILGSTGSVGEHTLDVIARHPDRFTVVALGAHRNVEKLADQCQRFSVPYAAMADVAASARLQAVLRERKAPTRVIGGADALVEIASLPEAHSVMAAIVGAAGLRSTLAAARAGKRLLLANKESLVMAGPLLLRTVSTCGATLLPIDSEHNAVFQCLPPGVIPGVAPPGVKRILLTASGGPFLDADRGHPGAPLDPAERVLRDQAALGVHVAHRQLDLQPRLVLGVLGPDPRHLGTRVAGDHRRLLRGASDRGEGGGGPPPPG
jgi:1-deoxy-D-xylulose-5-phosphate reductoisomerase